MSGKKYGKAELRIVLFDEEKDILTSSGDGKVVDVFGWFGDSAKDWEDEF